MKQVIQTFRTGELSVAEVPTPAVKHRSVLVRTCASLVSAGTERMVVNFAEKNLLQKAKARPDLVRQVFDKVQTDGIVTAIESVRNRMDQPLALGYSSAGIVIAAGSEAEHFSPGDHVACAGGGYAGHAEIVSVPRNLVVKVPATVSFDSACFATMGAIAMQGVRQAEVALGDNVAVVGLGLLGQLAVQLLKAAGCRVFGIDPNAQRVSLALEMGANSACVNAAAVATAQAFTSGRGFDAVLITADTASSDPVQLAGQISRSRATVVAVGAVGMDIPRKLFYEKELTFRLSRSYGPGRYDPDYEEKGNDYPYEYVRWTEQRNLEAFIELLADNKIDVHQLITHRFEIKEAAKAYELITGKTDQPFLGVVLIYPEAPDTSDKIVRSAPVRSGEMKSDRVRLGVVGAGNFATTTLLPCIKKIQNVELIGIASAGGLSARNAADGFDFSYCTTDFQKVVMDDQINTIAILTRHNQHATQVISALKAGKHVYVEKPLCLTNEELTAIIAAYNSKNPPPALMVGFNRRFAPFVVELKEKLKELREPLMLSYRVNAGFVAKAHWIHDLSEGGGRLLGEGCHFIDLLIYLADSDPKRVIARALPDIGRYSRDNFLVTIEFVNGSIGTLTYVSSGDKGFPKESLEVFGGGLAAQIDNYRALRIRHNGKQIRRVARLRQDKGYDAEWKAFVAHILGDSPAPIAFEDLLRSTAATIAAHNSLLSGEAVLFAHPSDGKAPSGI